MITPHLVEQMLAGLVQCDEACEAYPELGHLRGYAATHGVPLQWALASADVPNARGLLAHAALALLDWLVCLDEADEVGATDGCPLWHALDHAPEWLLRPTPADDAHDDIGLLLERDADHSGDWQAMIESLHQGGSTLWQEAIQRCRAMQRFEAERGIDLRDLLHGMNGPGATRVTPAPEQAVQPIPTEPAAAQHTLAKQGAPPG